MFLLCDSPIDVAGLRRRFDVPEAGAFVAFEGTVRNHNAGRQVTLLEYEAYRETALVEGAKILKEARLLFDIREAGCVHRVGALEIGDVAVWVGVAAGHRDAAFAGCRFVIDEVKSRVPIWKREHYDNEEKRWL